MPKQEGLQLEEASFRDHHPVEYAEIHNPSALGYDHPFNMDAYWSPISTHIPWKIHSFVQDYLTNLNSLGGPWGSLGVPGHVTSQLPGRVEGMESEQVDM